MSDASAPADWPTVSVIVLNYNGLGHLRDGLPSLAELDYPADRLELMVMDNGSTDGSVDYVRSAHPDLRLVQSSENLGFAGGNNLGARQAHGDHVVFLNNDMTVDPGLVRGLVEALRSDPEAVSAGAKILSWDGAQFDFAGAICNFTGHADQVGFEEPYDPDRYNQVVPMLFACGGAMIVDRQVFLDAGGFDEDYFIYFEDVDLGWRLWLLGHKVVFAPDAITYHRHHGTMERFPSYRKMVLYERNALCTVVKNYGAENLGRVLPAVLLGMASGVVERSVDAGLIDLDSFSIKSQKKMDRKRTRLEKGNVASLVAMQQVAAKLPHWMEKRQLVQERRKRSDEEIAHLFRPYFPRAPFWWPNTAYASTQALGVQELFARSPRRILVVSPDVLPYPGLPTVGSGLRAWSIGEGLRSAGHDVVFSMPRSVADRFDGQLPGEAARLAWDPLRLGDIVRRVQPDVVVACGWPVLSHLLHSPGVPVILDQHGPHMLERELHAAGDSEADAAEKVRALRLADYFTCPGERQVSYFDEWLERAGWTKEDRAERVATVPVSLSPELPERRPGPELSFVYGGQFLPWQDPSVGLETLVAELERRQSGRLTIYGDSHPSFRGGPVADLVERLAQSPRVVSAGLVSHDELVQEYTRAHVAIDLMKSNPERQLAFTTRTAEYLWCGLPVIYNDYAELAGPIREYEAGWTVDPEDAGAVAEVVAEIFERPELVEERSRNAQRLVRERLTWDRTIAPVDGFVRRTSMRRAQTPGDRVSALLPAEVTLFVQRLREKLPPAVDERALRLLAALGGSRGAEPRSDDSPIPAELALVMNRVVRRLPLPVAKAAKTALRRRSGA